MQKKGNGWSGHLLTILGVASVVLGAYAVVLGSLISLIVAVLLGFTFGAVGWSPHHAAILGCLFYTVGSGVAVPDWPGWLIFGFLLAVVILYGVGWACGGAIKEELRWLMSRRLEINVEN